MRLVYAVLLMTICYGASAQPVEELWARTFSGDMYGSFDRIIQTSDGGYAVGGIKDLVGPGQDDFWMMKLNAAGESEWICHYGTDSVDALQDLVEIDDGFVLAGISEGYPPVEEAALLIRLDANGDSVGSFYLNDYIYNHFHRIVKTFDGGVFAVGDATNDPNRDIDWLLSGVKLDASLELDWLHYYLPGYNCWGYVAIATADSGYALGCNPDGTSGLLRIDADGVQEWFSQVGQPGAVVELPDGGFAGLVSSPSHSTMRIVDYDGEEEDIIHFDYGYSYDNIIPPYVHMERFRDEGLIFPVDLEALTGEPGKFALVRLDIAGDSLWMSDSFIQNWSTIVRDLTATRDGGFAMCGGGMISGDEAVNWIFRTTPDGSIVSTHSLTAILEGDGVRLRWSVNPELSEIIEGFRIYGTTSLSEPFETYLGFAPDTTYLHESALAESDLFYYFIVSKYGFAGVAADQQFQGDRDGSSVRGQLSRHSFHHHTSE